MPNKPKRVMPVKKQTIQLKDDYDGWSFAARINMPIKTLSMISDGTLEGLIGGLSSIVLSWNFVDETGKALGKPTDEIIGSLPFDLVSAMATAMVEAGSELTPN